MYLIISIFSGLIKVNLRPLERLKRRILDIYTPPEACSKDYNRSYLPNNQYFNYKCLK